ncbi:MAG TPA: hypothetical protein VGG98_08080 [Solirubrobacteraceae bacterium]|jgi:hypothetical protein
MIARADAICRRLNAELAASKPASQGVHEIARVAPRRAALEQAAVSELSKLMPPAKIAREWQRVVAYRRTLAQELVKAAQFARANDIAAIRSLATSKARGHKELNAIAIRAGFTDCARIG